MRSRTSLEILLLPVTRPGDHTPIERESRSVPTHNGLRVHHDKSLFPSGPEPSRQDPEELIEGRESWPGMSSFQYRELLAKSEVFEKQPATTVEESENRTRQKYKRVYHVRVLPRFACEWQCRILLKSQADRILARDWFSTISSSLDFTLSAIARAI